MPLWLRIVWSLLVCVVLPINFKYYGPANLLWFSDIALLMITAALWLSSPLLASMAALSVLLLEIAWNIDFMLRLISGIRGVGLADYMFDSRRLLRVRLFSLFHIPLPLLLIWMIARLGYDPRALV